MIGSLSQLVTLVSYGNAFLKHGISLEEFYPANLAFQYCNEVLFVDAARKIKWLQTKVAANPIDWLRVLKRTGCHKVALTHTATDKPDFPDYISVAFVGGGGHWFAVPVFADHADFWLDRWEVTDKDAPDRRIWRVTYGRVAKRRPTPAQFRNELPAATARLRTVLTEIEAFARKHKLDFFAGCFEKGLQALESSHPLELAYNKQILPSVGYGLAAQRLIAACSVGWVFGGMGSWNDLGFDDKVEDELYKKLSAELYGIINDSIQQSTNAFGLN